MAVEGTLARQFIEFASKGMQQVDADMQKIRKGLEAVENMAGKARAAFATLTGTITGFVTAGLIGTGEAQRMTVAFQQLNREIASIFKPAIDAVISAIEGLVGWFRGLSGEQQTLIRNFALAAAVATGFVALMPKLIAGIGFLKVGIKALTMQFYEMAAGVTAATGGLNLVIAAAAAVFALVFAKSDQLQQIVGRFGDVLMRIGDSIMRLVEPFIDIFGELFDVFVRLVEAVLAPQLEILLFILEAVAAVLAEIVNALQQVGILEERRDKKRSQIGAPGGGFEGLEDSFKRIQTAFLKSGTGRTVEDEQLEQLKAINKNTTKEQAKQFLRGTQSALVFNNM